MKIIKLGIGISLLIYAIVISLGIFIEPERNTENPGLLNCSPLGILKDWQMRAEESNQRLYHGRIVNGIHYAWYIKLGDPEPLKPDLLFGGFLPAYPRYGVVYADGSLSEEIGGNPGLGLSLERNLDAWVKKYLKEGGEFYNRKPMKR